MSNVGGPSATKRRLLSTAAHSAMLYAASVWARAMDTYVYKKKLSAVQRSMTLRVSSSIPPVELQARDRMEVQGGEDRRAVRRRLLERWQEQWSAAGKGRWTRRLIPLLEPWINRKYGEVDYHLTQVLSGHGSFRSYLHGICRAGDNECIYCAEGDIPEHTIFYCPRWQEGRESVAADIGALITADNLIRGILKSEATGDG